MVRVWVAGKTVWSCYPKYLSALEIGIIKCYINSRSFLLLLCKTSIIKRSEALNILSSLRYTAWIVKRATDGLLKQNRAAMMFRVHGLHFEFVLTY